MAGGAAELSFMTGQDARLLIGEAEPRRFEPGDVIVDAGSRPQALLFVSRGAVRVDGRTRVEAPALFGETAFVDGGTTLHRVVAEEPCDVHVIERVRVFELVESVPGFGARFYRSLATQLAHSLRAALGISPSALL
jgi:CRP-like cAMP-binding protein